MDSLLKHLHLFYIVAAIFTLFTRPENWFTQFLLLMILFDMAVDRIAHTTNQETTEEIQQRLNWVAAHVKDIHWKTFHCTCKDKNP